MMATDISSVNIVIENLLTNAIKFSKNPVKIDIDLKDNVLTIQDYGIGIAPDMLDHIWDKFSRFDAKIEGF